MKTSILDKDSFEAVEEMINKAVKEGCKLCGYKPADISDLTKHQCIRIIDYPQYIEEL